MPTTLHLAALLIALHVQRCLAFNGGVNKLGYVSLPSFEDADDGEPWTTIRDGSNSGANGLVGVEWSKRKWPAASGIKLINTITPAGTVKIPKLYYQMNSSSSVQIRRPTSRTFTWQGDELVILFNMTSLQSPLCTRLTPPLSWIRGSGCKVGVAHKTGEADSTIEITASRAFVENTLSCLRMNGLQREDLFRILDKGPWILAFDIRSVVPRLFKDLQTDLNLNQSQAIHIISHCPYLLAQYFKYKGRDVLATVHALIDVGYAPNKLADRILRFPSILSSPPDRIRGWQSLLQAYNVASSPGLFGSLLMKAPFMFYVNPPAVNDVDTTMLAGDASITASGFVAYEALRVLNVIYALNTSDMDKIIRTQPLILLQSAAEVKRRINFLLNLFLENSEVVTFDLLYGASGGDSVPYNCIAAQDQLAGVVLTYPAILSISFEQMRAAANALRDNGLRRREVIFVAKRYPPVLGRSAADLKSILTFFRYQCGLRKEEVIPFINRCPSIFGVEVADMQAKVNYLYQSLGGTPTMIRKFPSFFSYDLDTHIRPRAEFLRALGLDPLLNGLVYLLVTPAQELAKYAGVKVKLYNEFHTAYLDMWKMKKQKDAMSRVTDAPLRIFPIPATKVQEERRFSDDLEAVLDDLDFEF